MFVSVKNSLTVNKVAALIGLQFSAYFKFSACRSSRPKVLYKKRVDKNLGKFTGKQLCRSLFFLIQIKSLKPHDKETPAQVFSCEFSKIF